MIAQTSPLPQFDMQQAVASTNNSGRSMALRRMLPMLLINAVAPFVINLVARSYMSTIDALLLASSVPALFTLGSLIWKKRLDVMGVLVVVGLLLSAVFALLFKSPQLLLLQSSAVNGLLGLGMLLSLLLPRPALFYIVRSIMTQNDPQRLASFNADWSFPQFRTFYRNLTAAWGCVTVVQVMLLAFLVFNLPISLMLVLSPILTFGVVTLTAHWSIYYFRKNKPIFEQLRQKRHAATSKTSC